MCVRVHCVHTWMHVCMCETYHTIGVHATQVDLGHKADDRGDLWVLGSTFNLQTVYPVLIYSLRKQQG